MWSPYTTKPGLARLALNLWRENGFRWTAYWLAHKALLTEEPRFARLVNWIASRMDSMERRRDLPGQHAVALNRLTWDQYQWGDQSGEEWTVSPEWKRSLVEDVLIPHIRKGGTVVEIGPGAGRWSKYLQRIARHLILVDVSARCIELCKERLADATNVEFHLVDGQGTLPFIEDESIDSIWSFDVFVHVAPRDTESYAREFARILKRGGQAVIHHGAGGGERGGWRSRMTAVRFAELVGHSGLELVRQFDEWGAQREFDVKTHHDAISVIRKP